MKILLLKHPTLGICAQEVLSRANYSDKIKRRWAKKYGQIINSCTYDIYDNGLQRTNFKR